MNAVSRLCGLALALTVTFPAHAAEGGDAMSRLKPALGNTIVSTHPDGRKARLWLDAAGGYRAQGRAGERSAGVWKIKDEKLCLSQRRPLPIPFSYCKAIPDERVGKPWRDKAVNGDMVMNEIVRGADGASD